MIGLLFVVGVVGAVLAAPVLALIALQRTAALRALEERVAALERAVRASRAQGTPEAPPAAVPPARAAAPAAPAPPPRAADAPRPAPSAPAPPAPPRPPVPPRAPIEWERLFGVRGAAILGGVALALAGLLFFRYSIEHGLIPPWLRVVLGTATGVAAIVGSEQALRRRYPGTANAVAGAGVVILYAAFWAAAVRYGLVGLGPAFVVMIAVTAAACALSWRHDAQVIALLGLAGGFATPFLLSSDADRPIGLFGYLLLLDLALLLLARARRWPWLAAASLAATAVYEGGWLVTRMGADRLPLGLAILGVFALVYGLGARHAAAADGASWRAAQAGGLLVPFGFALHLAGDARLGPHLLPHGLLLLVLSVAAGWLARAQGAWWLRLGAAVGGVAVVLAWAARWAAADAPAWEPVAVAVVLAAVFQAFVELEPARSDGEGPAPAAIASTFGLFLALVYAMERAPGPPWPWIAGWAALAALALRHAGLADRAPLHVAAALAVGVALLRLDGLRALAADAPPLAVHLALLVGGAAAFQVVALLRRGTPWAEHAAAAVCVPLLVALVPSPAEAGVAPWATRGTAFALGLLVALAALRLGSGAWLLAAVGLTAYVHTAAGTAGDPRAALATEAGAVVLFTAWPFLAPGRFRDDRAAWIAAALAAPCWFLSMKALWERAWGDDAIGLLPVALAAVGVAATARVREVFPPSAPRRTGVLALFAAVALGFVSVAVPLQLEKEWITIGWAVEGVAVAWLWTRLPHPGLKWLGLALLAAVTVRLVANPAVLGYWPRAEWRIVNWLLYTYLVPAAALLAAAALLGPRELARLTPWERERLYRHGRPLGALATGLAGLGVIFVWINLAIADWFASGPRLTVSFERLAARDLATSIAWALYALALLAVGLARASSGLRWVSLGLLVATIAKVFLYDLGELRDLYRVASLAGLAVSLLLVSLAYQRFVFRSAPVEKT